jgi:hypothetical protein
MFDSRCRLPGCCFNKSLTELRSVMVTEGACVFVGMCAANDFHLRCFDRWIKYIVVNAVAKHFSSVGMFFWRPIISNFHLQLLFRELNSVNLNHKLDDESTASNKGKLPEFLSLYLSI